MRGCGESGREGTREILLGAWAPGSCPASLSLLEMGEGDAKDARWPWH